MKRMVPSIDQWGRATVTTKLGSGLEIPIVCMDDVPEGRVVIVQGGKVDFKLLREKWLYRLAMERLCGPSPGEEGP